MTDRSPAERPTACPFLAFDDDRDYRSDRPDHRHRCFAEPQPAPRAISHQELFCIGGAFGECPTFAAWAAREAATVRRPTIRRGEASAPPRAGAERSPYAPPGPTAEREWQAPPPWMAEAAAAAAAGSAAAGRPASTPASEPPADLGLDDDYDYEPPAFLAGRTSRPPSSGAGAAGAGAGAAGAGATSSTFIGGTAGAAADEDDLGELVSDRDAAYDGGAAYDRDPFPPVGGAYGSPAGTSRPASGAGAGAVAGGAGATAAAGASRPPAGSQPISGRSTGAYGRPASSGRASSDALWVEPDVDLPAEDEPWEDPVEAAAAARVARNAPRQQSSRFGLGKSRQPSGQARPQPQRAADPAAPSWERPRRFEAYPAIKSSGGGGGSRGIPRIAIWLGLLALAALALFLIPPMLLGGGGGSADATPTPSASAEASPSESVAPTPVPQPTPFVYKVKAGDTVSGIAAKYKITVDELLAANPDLKDPNALQIGDKLVVPLPASSVIPDAGTPDAEVTAAP